MSRNRCGFVFVLIGKRDLMHITESIKRLREMWFNCEIEVYCDDKSIVVPHKDLKMTYYRKIPFDTREGNRNSSMYRLVALQNTDFDIVCYMDNDVYVVHEGFAEGFKIADKYGLAMAMNPRTFVKTYDKKGDLDIGADTYDCDKVSCNDLPFYTTSVNMGVMFYNNKRTGDHKDFVTSLIQEQSVNPVRGQANLARVMNKTNYYPYILPQQFLACRDIETPLAVHVGNGKTSHYMIEKTTKREVL